MGNAIRLTKENENEIKHIIAESGNFVLTVPRAANIAVGAGLKVLRDNFPPKKPAKKK